MSAGAAKPAVAEEEELPAAPTLPLTYWPTFQRVLVTGGAGFLGSHLCRRLLREGHSVICLDNLFTSSKHNVRDMINHPNFEFVRHDVTEPYLVVRGGLERMLGMVGDVVETWSCRSMSLITPFYFSHTFFPSSRALSTHEFPPARTTFPPPPQEVDLIFNMACPASPVHYQYNPIKTTKTSVYGALNMLGLAKRVKARILQASTSEVYGDPDRDIQSEDYWGNVNPIGVRSCYDEGKRIAETLFFDYYRQHNVQIRVARIFNTYGPGMHPYDGRVVSNFIMQALNNEDITIYGDGSQTRSFCFVSDTVEGLIALMNQDGETGPCNIGNEHEMTIKELAETIIELLPETKSKLILKPLPNDDPKQRRPNITKAREKLGCVLACVRASVRACLLACACAWLALCRLLFTRRLCGYVIATLWCFLLSTLPAA